MQTSETSRQEACSVYSRPRYVTRSGIVDSHSDALEVYGIQGQQYSAELFKDFNAEVKQLVVETDIYGPSEREGFVKVVATKSLTDVLTEIVQLLPLYGISMDDLDYFDVCASNRGNMPFPRLYFRLICFPVTGGSEGHYIHVGVVKQDQTYEDLFLGKTFLGYGKACEIAQIIGLILMV